MSGDRSRYGLLVSALGAIVLAISVFLPWYGVSITASGIATVRELGGQLAAQVGDPTLQAQLNQRAGELDGLAGQQVTAVSAHQVLRDMNVILLVLAALALVDALLPLARHAGSVPDGAGGSVVLLGLVAAVCVLFRMIHPPTPGGGLIALSLREGAWLALLGSLAMVAGGLWPRRRRAVLTDQALEAAWPGLSGWSPGA
jgi:hypothetical protein